MSAGGVASPFDIYQYNANQQMYQSFVRGKLENKTKFNNLSEKKDAGINDLQKNLGV
jgi:hypothetical protein